MEHAARLATGYDSCHARSFIKFLAKPSAFRRVFHFFKRNVNCLPENLSDALLGRALAAMMRYASAKFRHYGFKGFLVCLLHCGAGKSTSRCEKQVPPSSLIGIGVSENNATQL